MNLSADLIERQQAQIAARLCPALTEILSGRTAQDAPPDVLSDALTSAIADYYAAYRSCPLRENKGGSQFNDGLSLFVTARLFQPALVIESGSYRGFSSWLLRQACPAAEIHSFDVDHGNLELRAQDVAYHLCDWLEYEIVGEKPDNTLIFFDDHISHARRILEAQTRGFRHLLVDDNFPVTALYATGGVPVPTVAMLCDDALKGGEELSWTRNNKVYRYRVDPGILARARRQLRRTVPLPDITELTEYASPSRMTYVELVGSNDKI